jgi:hypothetical protein
VNFYPQLKEYNEGWPKKRQILFRYDPAVVVVSLNWHERATVFAQTVYGHLTTKYTDHEDRV